MKQVEARFEDGLFTFLVSPISLDEYEEVSDLLEAAHKQYVGGKAVRSFAKRFVEVCAPERDGTPLTAADFGKLDPGLILALGRKWGQGVRDVPLPLALPSSAIGDSPDDSASPSPSTEPSSETPS